MASTYSSRLRIELIGTGEQSGTWGNTTNTNLGTLIDEAVAGVASISMTDADYTLTVANGATDESRKAVLVMSGSLSTTRNVICPSNQKVYIIKNNTTGGQSIVLKTSAGTGVTVPNGKTMLAYCDGTNVLTGSDAMTSISTAGTLTVDGATSLDDSVVINESGADKDFRVEGDADANLLFTDASTDRVGIGTNTPSVKLDVAGDSSFNGSVVINESGADKDFRVEGDTDANLLFTDASTDRVGVGTSTPDAKLTVNGVGAFGAGAAATPSIAATGDLNTGMWFPAADTVAVSTGGSERVRIDTSGNVGIGTSSPARRLHVVSSGTAPQSGILRISGNSSAASGANTSIVEFDITGLGGGSLIQSIVGRYNSGYELATYFQDQAVWRDNATNTERMRIDSSGNVGIGTSSPTSKLVVKTDTDFVVATTVTSGGTGARVAAFNAAQNAYKDLVVDGLNVIYSTQGSERARITSAGLFQVATTSQASGRVNISGYTNGGYYGIVLQPTANDSTPILFMNAAGTGIGQVSATSTGVTYGTSSDYRLKEKIQPMQNALAKVALLNPVTYTWKVDGSDGQGFIAHELQEVVPDAVTGEKDAVDKDGKPIYQGVDTSFLVATLTKAIQELKAELDAVKAELATVKGA